MHVVLFAAERFRRRAQVRELAAREGAKPDGGRELETMEYREAFVLREYENMPYEEIAALVGSTVSNVKSRVFRARQKIKKLLEPSIREFD